MERETCSSWEVLGGADPATWRYRIEYSTPGGFFSQVIGGAGVIHVRYATRPESPWRGLSPLHLADETRQLASWIERRLREESSTSTAYVLALPEGRADDDELKSDPKTLKGRLAVVDTTSGGWGGGQSQAPKGDWDSRRIGAEPPATVNTLRQNVRADVLALYGIPSEGFASGAAAEAGYRQFLNSTITPIAELVAVELADKLDSPGLAFDFGDLRAADIASRARAYKALVEAQMPATKAAQLTGLE